MALSRGAGTVRSPIQARRNSMKRIISILVVVAMMLASVLAVIPATATSVDEADVIRFLPDGALDALKAEFEKADSASSAYVNGVTPFSFMQEEAMRKFSGNRILGLTLPIKQVGEKFTISVFKIADIANGVDSLPVNVFEINVNTSELQAGKFATIDLTSYNIIVGDDETLTFGSLTDTLLPAWVGADTPIRAILDEKASFATGIYGYAGAAKANDTKQPGNSIFMDAKMVPAKAEEPDTPVTPDAPVDVPAGTKVTNAEEFKAALEANAEFYIDNDITLPADWAPVDFGSIFHGNGKTITLTGTKSIFGTLNGATLKSFTVVGDVTVATAIASGIGGETVTFEDVDVKVTLANGDAASPYVPANWSTGTSLVFRYCDNYTPVSNNSNAAAFVGGINTSGTITIENCNNFANVVGGSQTGGFLGHTWTNGITIKNSNNGTADKVITIKAKSNEAGGFIGASQGNITIENCVNYARVEGASSGAGIVGYTSVGDIDVKNFENYGPITASGDNAGGIVGKMVAGSVKVDGFVNHKDISAGLTAGAVGGWLVNNIGNVTLNNVRNLANISSNYVGGFIGAYQKGGATATITNSYNGSEDVNIKVKSSSYCAGGFIGECYGNMVVENSANYAVLEGGTGTFGGGIVATFGGNFTARNVVNYGDNNVKGAWNKIGSGFVGNATNKEATFSFTDCVNNGNMWFESSSGNNGGGFLGGNESCLAYKSISFVRCVNNGNISSTGNVGGFLGQSGGREYYFEDCVNNGELYSVNNTAGGFMPWGGGDGNATFIRCINNGKVRVDFHATQTNKVASGFVSGRALKYTMTDCANYGEISSQQGDAAGFANLDAKDGSVFTNCINLGKINKGVFEGEERYAYEFVRKGGKFVDCIITDFNADLVERLAKIQDRTKYDKDISEWKAMAAAFAAAKDVLTNAESTDEAKAEALAALDATIAKINTFLKLSSGSIVNGEELNVFFNCSNESGKDWIGLVKDGEIGAYLWAYVKDVKSGFNIFGLSEEAQPSGWYTVYLIPNDEDVKEYVLGNKTPLAAPVRVFVADGVIKTAEEFIAMGETGSYTLGADITLPADYAAKNFSGALDGNGHTITLTSNNGLFNKIVNATISNLTLKGDVESAYGLTADADGKVLIEGVTVELKLVTGQAAFIAASWHNGAEFIFRNCENKTPINCTANGTGAFIGGSNAKRAVFENCVNHSDIKGGYVGGFTGHTWMDVTFKNCVNYGNVTTINWCAGGFSGRYQGYFVIEDCVNNGNISGGYAYGGGIVGHFGDGAGEGVANIFKANNVKNYGDVITDGGWNASNGGIMGSPGDLTDTELYFINCENYGEVRSNNNANGGNNGGIVGSNINADGNRDGSAKIAVFEGCINRGNVSSKGNVGGIMGQFRALEIIVKNTDNYGDVTSESNVAGGFFSWNGGINSMTFENCNNYGKITALQGDKYAAGFVASASGNLKFTNCANYGTVKAGKSVAGITYEVGSSNTLELINCANYGLLISDNARQLTNEENENVTLTDCIAGGPIEGQYIEITNAAEFMAMRPGCRYILMNNIVLPEDYVAMNFGSIYHVAELDGNGKTIYMKGATCGLFDEIANAYIHDFKIIGSMTFAKKNGALAKTIALDAEEVVIENVVIDVDINGEAQAAGFIAGNTLPKTGKSSVRNVTFDNCAYLGNLVANGSRSGGFMAEFRFVGTLTFNNCKVGDRGLTNTITGKQRVAGFVGKVSGAGDNYSDTKVTYNNCVNYADITNTSGNDEGCIGAFGGRYQFSETVINGCANYGNMKSYRTTGWWQGVGGFLGEANNNAYITILASANYGDVWTERSVAGGLVGLVSNSSGLTIGALKEDGTVNGDLASANFGTVSCGDGWNMSVSGILGGAAYKAGYAYIDACGNFAKFYGTVNYGRVIGANTNAGGFIGMTEDNGGVNNNILLEAVGCANFGKITAPGANAAGFFGQCAFQTMKIIDCVNYGEITSGEGGGGTAAGIVGPLWSGWPQTLVVENCANIGNITNAKGTAVGIVVGAHANGSVSVVGNINYGRIVASGNAAGITEGTESLLTAHDNKNAGILIGAKASQIIINTEKMKEGSEIKDNEEAGVILTDSVLIEKAKTLANPFSYDSEKYVELVQLFATVQKLIDAKAGETDTTYDGEGATPTLEEAMAALDTAMASLVDRTALINAQIELAAMGDVDEDDAKAKALKEAIEAMDEATTQEELDKAYNDYIEKASSILDLTALKYQLAQAAKLDRYNYTAATWAELAKALEAADAEFENQAQVDEVVAALDKAIFNLADISELADMTKKAIADAEALNEEDYTAISWKVLLEKLAETKAALESGDSDRMDAAVVELKAAQEALISVVEIKGLIAEAEALNAEDYTPHSWELLLKSIEAAKAAIENGDPAVIAAATADIKAVKAALVGLTGIKTSIEELKTLDRTKYSMVSCAAIDNVIAIAERALTAYYESEVIDALDLISDLKASLVDVTELSKLIDEYSQLDASKYTATTWAALTRALASAKLKLISADSADEVAQAISALNAAKNGLRRHTEVKTDDLMALIAEVEALNASDYTAESWNAVKTALAEAKVAVYAETQTKVKNAQEKLNAAKEALVSATAEAAE